MEKDNLQKLTNSRPCFEDKLNVINSLLNKHRHKWNIKAIAGWMDWDDVCQIIRIHIFNKWQKFNYDKPLEPWVNTIINNQMINLSRNVYYSNERPCLQKGGCVFNEGGDICSYTPSGKQCDECPLFKKWQSKKQNAHNIRLPLPLVNHMQEVHEINFEDINLDKAIENFHIKMKEILKPLEYRVYSLLYIKHLSEEDAAIELGYSKSTSYNNFLKIKKNIMEIANKIKNEIDFV